MGSRKTEPLEAAYDDVLMAAREFVKVTDGFTGLREQAISKQPKAAHWTKGGDPEVHRVEEIRHTLAKWVRGQDFANTRREQRTSVEGG